MICICTSIDWIRKDFTVVLLSFGLSKLWLLRQPTQYVTEIMGKSDRKEKQKAKNREVSFLNWFALWYRQEEEVHSVIFFAHV